MFNKEEINDSDYVKIDKEVTKNGIFVHILGTQPYDLLDHTSTSSDKNNDHDDDDDEISDTNDDDDFTYSLYLYEVFFNCAKSVYTCIHNFAYYVKNREL